MNIATHPFDNTQAVSIVALEDVGTHERKDRHDVVHELIGNERTKLGEEEESLVGGLGVDRCCRARGQKVQLLREERDSHRMRSRTGVMRIESLVTPEVGCKDQSQSSPDVQSTRTTDLDVLNDL